jgi:isocitrate lyase
MGCKFQVVTFAGLKAINHGMFGLALDYRDRRSADGLA